MTQRPLTGAEAAEYLGISIRRIHNLNAADNDFPEPEYTGRTPTWTTGQLDAWRTTHPARRHNIRTQN
ncbi:DNA-binding protein [Streptomyces sp. SID12501]|uniref:DNA-binding protein n=2 Tax=Streptomyces sp. SID12501 TaxID=2706042 RepID=A0A6B3BGV2_9ACTN|nr:DNA-binding protein [Streptomyces sp. SID12501]NEC84931.1 DNA-binding protein [Streptomyces sp. SID12501]